MTEQASCGWDYAGLLQHYKDAEAEVVRLRSVLSPLEEGLRAWQPIETAPEGRKVLVTWVNSHGKRRTAMASYWPAGTLEMSDDVPDWQVTEHGTNLDPGWWEESEGNDDAMFRLVEKMTHWMPLPSPPDAALLLIRSPQDEEKTPTVLSSATDPKE